MKSKVIYDWVSITSKIHSPEGFIRLLGFEKVSWQSIKGMHGYRDRYYYNCISIHYNGRDDMGVWLEMSGQGCRVFETIGNGDYEGLFAEVHENPDEMRITRLDVAFDDLDGILDMDELVQDTRAGNYVAKAKAWQITESNKGQSIVIGAPSSDVLIRIYDKAMERGITDRSKHWIRCELQLRDDRCRQFTLLNMPFGEAYAGVLHNYLRYVCPDTEDVNKWRWPLTDYWANLLNGAARISIYEKPGMEYNLARCENYVYNQAGNAIDALIDIYGIEAFYKNLKKRHTGKNPKYDFLRDQYKVKRDNADG